MTTGARVTHGARQPADPRPGPRGPRDPAEVRGLLRKVLAWLVFAFVLFYIISAPESSADFVRTAGQAIGDAATSLASFFESLA